MVINHILDGKKKHQIYSSVSVSLRAAAYAACSEFEYYVHHVHNKYFIKLDMPTISDAFVCLCEHADLPSADTGIFLWRGQRVSFSDIMWRAVELERAGIAILIRARVSQSKSIIMRWAPPGDQMTSLVTPDDLAPAIARRVVCNYRYTTEHELIFVKQVQNYQEISTLPVNEPFFSKKTIDIIEQLHQNG